MFEQIFWEKSVYLERIFCYVIGSILAFDMDWKASGYGKNEKPAGV